MRLVLGEVTAERATSPWSRVRASNPAAALGLRYEKAVWKSLKGVSRFSEVEHNPWFSFHDRGGAGMCSPDFLLWDRQGGIIIVEVKLTWTPEALVKLRELYIPIIRSVHNEPIIPLVVTKNLFPGAPRAESCISAAIASESALLHWLGQGPLLW